MENETLTYRAFEKVIIETHVALKKVNEQCDIINSKNNFDLSDIAKLIIRLVYLIALIKALCDLIDTYLVIEKPKPQLLLTEKPHTWNIQ